MLPRPPEALRVGVAPLDNLAVIEAYAVINIAQVLCTL